MTKNFVEKVLILVCMFSSSSLLSACGSNLESATDSTPNMPAEDVTQVAPPTETAAEPQEFLGEDVFFDRFMKVLPNISKDYGFDTTALPTKQSGLTRQFSVDQVNPGRCAELATLVNVGFDATGGPLQYVMTMDSWWSETDNTIVAGKSRNDFLEATKITIPECEKFQVKRDSPAVINFTPTQDTLNYTIEKTESISEDTLLIAFTAKGQAQVDTQRISSSRSGYMDDKQLNGYLMARQVGENLVTFLHVHVGYGERSPKPLVSQSDFERHSLEVMRALHEEP